MTKSKGVQVNLYNIMERIKSALIWAVKSRLFILLLIFCVLSAVLIQRVFELQIVMGEEYLENHKLQIQKMRKTQGTRGRILDRNGVVLADNILSYSVTIEDNGEYDDRKEKNAILNETILETIRIVEKDNGTLLHDFNVILNEDGQYEYSVAGTRRLRFLADVYGLKTIDELGDKAEYTAEQLIEELCSNPRSGYDLDQEALSKEDILKIVNVQYAIGLNSFQKYLETTIATDISERAVAEIMENLDRLQGIGVKEDSLRNYVNGEYFAGIIGYTGKISQGEYEALTDKEQENYELTDIVGKAGIEKEMDAILQGDKGVAKLYVDNRGRIIEQVEATQTRAGDDIYLTLDSNLQIAAYKILEEKLAGIILAKLTNVLSWDRTGVTKSSEVIIPIGEVYHSFIDNDLIDTTRFTRSEAGETEANVYAAYLAELEGIIATLHTELSNPAANANNDLPTQLQEYLTFIIQDMLTEKAQILLSKEIDTTDETYLQWKEDGQISAYNYLNYALAMNWVDSSKLTDYMPAQTNYSNYEEVYQGILQYITEELNYDSDFKKLVYRNMIQEQKISGSQICLLLYEQGILEYDEYQVSALASGSVAPYDFIRSKIETLEITPGQIALEPSTGSFVMTNSTGELLACVSYPGYDNNRLANTVDSTYFSQLFSNNASPLYNKATQERTAPGSTYKPLSAIVGLTENTINSGTRIQCTGIFENVHPNPTCWIYPSAHGYLNAEESLQHSCNVFFYDLGYRLGIYEENGTTRYSSELGLEKMNRYAEIFGLDSQTGIEIPENIGKLSDEDAVRSAIGQGSHNYTTVQLARYANTLAHRGTLYDLTLLDKITDITGEVVEDFIPSPVSTDSSISSSTWSTVQAGMRRVVSMDARFNSVTSTGFMFSGKTGTSQQSKMHADHALFLGYAPSDNPEIAFACRIANGYSSAYAAEVGRDVMRYYYDLAQEHEIITSGATFIDNNVHID